MEKWEQAYEDWMVALKAKNKAYKEGGDMRAVTLAALAETEAYNAWVEADRALREVWNPHC